ncbi:hypothetical protein [Natranaerofaba carboxydovora]|uniref:hypothetical protein n=1 Tax=Natranaerofaba carboxydovora TaxID=2742683 RepID=UPI001F1292C4|nr:hypothetical protein [Natranaerofaba carboxydovora]UMZ73169.1 hypothetical protein ACONDI_00722 [Natranaerofaba carboxydovora]
MSEQKKEKKGLLSKIFGKSNDQKTNKGGCCSVRIEAEDENTSNSDNDKKQN